MTVVAQIVGRRFLLRIGALMALVAILVCGFLVPVRSADILTSSAEMLSNDHEAFIFVEQNKLAWSENVFSFVIRGVESWFTATVPPNFRRIDCTVFRITTSGVEQHQANGWHVVGSIAPFDGAIYAFGGKDRNWKIFRWSGDKFDEVSKSDPVNLAPGSSNLAELFKREGWNQAYIFPVRGSAEHDLTLDGQPLSIHASQSQGGKNLIELIKSTTTGSDRRVLYDNQNMKKFLSHYEYSLLTD